MSFILDALKKSEKKRQTDKSTQPRSIHEPEVAFAPKQRRYGWWLIAAGVVGGIALTFVLVSWWFSQPRDLGTDPAVAPTTQSAAAQAPKKAEPTSLEAPVVPPPTRPAPAPAPAVKPVPKEVQQAPAAVPTPVKKALPLPRSEKKIYRLSQLPSSVRNRLPELHLSLHAFNRSNPDASMVQLNNQMYRKGASVSGQLRLEEITSDGVVMRYDGYRFMLPRRGN